MTDFIKLHLKAYFYYRSNYLFSLLIDPFLLVIKILLFRAIYAYNHTELILGYTYTRMVWYFAGVNFINYLTWNFTDSNLTESIFTGDIIVRLAKPFSIVKWEFGKAVAFKLGSVFLEFIPSLVIYMVIIFPDFLTITAFLKFCTCAVLSFIIYFLINFIIGTTAFKTQNTESLQSLKTIIFTVAAGAFIPIDFYPGFLRDIISILPFQYVCYVPVRILIGLPETSSFAFFIKAVGIQLFWILVLYGICRLYWKRMVKHFCAIGG